MKNLVCGVKLENEKLTNTTMDMMDLLDKRGEELEQVLVITTTDAEDGTNIFICSTCDTNYQALGLLEWAKEVYKSNRSIPLDDSDE